MQQVVYHNLPHLNQNQ